ncbi:FecR family protein [Achromobacter seleniivolatilans]|uniref:FecR family protein n=1 Tax=Achromobacter seleniivolatilans TaxID=3047478 RepID=A0ABY9LUB1_9BURK|nr:FecR family protein [Achromobacter sp. R39]WMD18132.1 FecR family protein [Achromobacter sp. R39]
MTESSQPDPSETAAQAAAGWFARMRSGEASAQVHAEFQQWRNADPAHAQAYAEMETVWNATTQFDAQRLRQTLRPQRAPAMARRRLAFGLALSAAAIAGVTWNFWPAEPILQEQTIATRAGERRQIQLSDGSILDVNTATRARVRLYASRREVELNAGEIMFSVTPDSQRPFLVDAGNTQVRVTGTRFDVRRDGETAAVAVDSGSVTVTAGGWWQRREAHLTAGQGVRTLPGSGLAAVEPVDAQAVTAWRQGKIVFANATLADVAAEMNRYLTQPILLSDARLARLRIAGVFSVDDPSAFLTSLPAMAPVEVLRGADGAILIRPR